MERPHGVGDHPSPPPLEQARRGTRIERQDGPELRPGTSRIIDLRIERVESPTFEGKSFGEVGQYKKIVGTLRGEVDPGDLRNATITDLAKAPRNERGLVEYKTDFYLVAPADSERGNGFLVVEVVNRGNKLMIGFFDRVAGSNDPTKAADAGDGFLFEQGFTLLWIGWQGDLNAGNNRVRLQAPIASDGNKPITGVVRAEFLTTTGATTLPLSSGSFTGTTHQSYPSVSLDNSGSTLTRRLKEADDRQRIPNDRRTSGASSRGSRRR